MPIRLVLAEDHYLVREGIRRLLETHPDLDVAAVCEDLGSLLATVEAQQPDVVLTDIRMPPTNTDEGIRLANELRETHPGIGVVVLSQHNEPAYAVALFAAGSEHRAYLLKERVRDADELGRALEAVAEGRSVVDPAVVDGLLKLHGAREETRLNTLTPREREILALIAEGRSNAAIGDTLALNKRAVERHINGIFTKLDLGDDLTVSRRVRAALIYLAGGED